MRAMGIRWTKGWPVGVYNGRRITGINFRFRVDVTAWNWRPMIVWVVGGFHWLCFYTWTEWEYEPQWQRNLRESK